MNPAEILQPELRGFARIACLALVCLFAGTGCGEKRDTSGNSVTGAWRDRPPKAKTTSSTTRAPDLTGGASDSADTIAFVNGTPISRSRVVDLLMAGHGVGILEQIVVLERAKALATEQGVKVTQADIDAEFDRSLRSLASPLHAAGNESFDRDETERILDEVLARRNVSRAECMAMVTRNAYLRAICNANITFTDEQFAEEYQRAFGPRVQVRHIQLASLSEAEHVAGLLETGGDFATIAEGYSANLRTGPAGGLLRPFAIDDPDVPRALAQAAFKLGEGQISDPIRDGEWYHIIRVERHLPADSRTINQVKGELERRLRDRLIEPAMQTLYRSLFEQADIRVTDPVLAEEFAKKHPGRQ
ncbi:MAG: peptidyl-prolyl cis-trans isomerase [Phycisphaerales bacterium]|nr:peptidyl-prolyl cis-trans isomerase [Phycisphaerales bacterium]